MIKINTAQKTINIAFPKNYDFGANWKTKIVPLLDNKKLQASIKKGICEYIKKTDRRRLVGKKYNFDSPPADFDAGDLYLLIDCEIRDRLIEKLRDKKKLPARYLYLEKIIRGNKKVTQERYNKVEDEYWKLEKEILEPFRKWDKIMYDLENYIFFADSYMWSKYFNLPLAKLVDPKEKWMIRQGIFPNQATVINEKGDRIFDINAWASDGRLENYVFQDDTDFFDNFGKYKRDVTLGGESAYLSTSKNTNLINMADYDFSDDCSCDDCEIHDIDCECDDCLDLDDFDPTCECPECTERRENNTSTASH